MKRSILRLLAAIQLTRLTMAFGAVSDVWLVILLTRSSVDAGGSISDASTMSLWLALFAGAIIAVGLFAYGASLNDVLDARHDTAFSPSRPIPAGRIRVGQAIIVTVGALLIAVLGGQAFGTWSLQLTLLTAVGILFYNAAGRFIPAVGINVIGIIHAAHMMIPNPMLGFTLPVWFVMTHAMVIGAGAYILEGKRPRMTRPTLAAIVVGWMFWSLVVLGVGGARGGLWPDALSVVDLVWPLGAAVTFVFVARWKMTGVPGAVAAEKLHRYGAMWQALYSSMWLFALDLEGPAIGILLFAIVGFVAMTIIKEAMGQLNNPLTWRA